MSNEERQALLARLRPNLVRLPQRALAAFAARCARRVLPLADILLDDSRDAIERAIVMAETVARGGEVTRAAAEAAARAAVDESQWDIGGFERFAVDAAELAALAAEAASAAVATAGD